MAKPNPDTVRAGIKRFFDYAQKRQTIKQRRELGMSPPWTSDTILQQYRFCNVFREDDRTTHWFRTYVRDPLQNSSTVLMATIIFRWFNRIETGEVLRAHNLLQCWDTRIAREVLKGRQPLVTGAYVIKTPPRLDKLDGLIWCIDQIWPRRQELYKELRACFTLREAHQALMEFDYLGAFMAYEIVTDLHHTIVLRDANGAHWWAHLGPGAARGLGRIFFRHPDYFSHNSKRDQGQMRIHANQLLNWSRDRKNWPWDWPQWSMREVEHTLCEFDKYERARLGEGRLKRRYEPCTSSPR